jgi:hypothetical protein
MNVSSFNGNGANQIAVINIFDTMITGYLRDIGTQVRVPFTAVKWAQTDADGGSLFLGTASGQLFRLDRPHTDTIAQEITGNQFPVGYISSIETGQTADTLLVTLSNYGIPSVFVSANGGDSWKEVEGNLPDMPVRYGIFHPQSAHQVMLATETGTWVSEDVFDHPVTWTPQVNGLANVRVDMLRIRPADLTVLAASHGMGLYTARWDLQGASGIPEAIPGDDLLVYPNPTTGAFRIDATLPDRGTLTISDLNGRLVRSIELQPGSIHLPIDLQKEAKGVYLVKIEHAGGSAVRRVVVGSGR